MNETAELQLDRAGFDGTSRDSVRCVCEGVDDGVLRGERGDRLRGLLREAAGRGDDGTRCASCPRGGWRPPPGRRSFMT